MNLPITQADAIARYPELAALVPLSQAGWVFRMIFDDQNEPGCVVGSRSLQRYTDAIVIYDRTHTSAARMLDDAYGGGCVWKTESRDLTEVVHDLLGLPEPDTPGAPHLVRGSSLLWTPQWAV